MQNILVTHLCAYFVLYASQSASQKSIEIKHKKKLRELLESVKY